VILSNGTVNTRIGHPLTDKVTASITAPRKILMAVTAGQAVTIDKVISDGTVKIEGDQNAVQNFLNNIQNFDLWFNIVEP
jgi:alkyl sulfatase BDS1-like metallo-beta-lactamase superfamily hydrolase